MHLLCTTSISAKNTNNNRATELLLFCIKVDKRRKKWKGYGAKGKIHLMEMLLLKFSTSAACISVSQSTSLVVMLLLA